MPSVYNSERIDRSINGSYEKEEFWKQQLGAYEQHNFVCGWRYVHNIIDSQHCMHVAQSV